MDEERAKILKMIETGAISAEQGLALLNALESHTADEETGPSPAASPTPPPEVAQHWRHVWLYVVYAGAAIVTIGALLLYAMYAGGSAWWGVCGWPVLALGVGVVVLGAWSRTARWLHVRVTGRKERVAISMPLPLKLAAWAMKTGQRLMPEKFKATGLDEVIMSLEDSLDESGGPFYVNVTDEQDGEHVQVYIG